MSALRIFAAGVFLTLLAGCQSTYYNAWEKMGYHKRDILVERVQDAKTDQETAKKEFQTTLDQFKAVTNFKADELEARYKKLNADYTRCAAAADDVNKRIASVESVAGALFTEWKGELKEYKSADLRQASETELRETQAKYDQLIGAMKKAASKMQPVLDAFHDQVIFLKHSLNAKAIASLDNTRITLEKDVGALIKEMETSINEANSFIQGMKEPAK